MLLISIIATGVIALAFGTGLLTYRIKRIKRKRAYIRFLKKMGYDNIGYA